MCGEMRHLKTEEILILVLQHKKGSKLDSQNFRGISLLSIVGRVFSRFIWNKLIDATVNNVLPGLVCCFHSSCGTDMIFSARQLQEKCREQNLPLHHCFFDLSKVLDIRRLLAYTGVSSSLVRDLLYADDRDIVTHSEDEMQCFMNCFVHSCKVFRLEINLKRSVMHDPEPGLPNIEPVIYVEEKKLDIAYSLVYLGSMLAERSLCALKKLLDPFQCVWFQHGIKLKAKVMVYKACVLTSLLYTREM